MAERVVYQDGVRVQDGQIRLDADDPGLLLGWSVFETLRWRPGRIIGEAAHLERLRSSAGALRVALPDEQELIRVLRTAAQEVGAAEVALRVTVTRGGSWIVRATDAPRPLAGMRVATRPQPQGGLPGWVKHVNRTGWELAVLDAGVDEVVWRDERGNLLEGTRSSLLAVADGRLWTPPLDGRILPGVTRARVLDAAERLGLGVREEPLPRTAETDELYLISTLKWLVPIVEIDGQPGPGGGPVGDRVRTELERD